MVLILVTQSLINFCTHMIMYVTQAYNGSLAVDKTFYHFSKAFNITNHALLLTKLSCIGVDGCLLRWLKD